MHRRVRKERQAVTIAHGIHARAICAKMLMHEWIFAMQTGKKMQHIMMMQHSFPTVSMINKMVAEQWMMGKMKLGFVQKMAKWLV